MTITIGGPVCREPLAERMLPAEPRPLVKAEVDGLWQIYAAIGDCWKNTVYGSNGLKSSWLEFITERSVKRPSYVAEYVNALEVVRELVAHHGDEAMHKLFFESGENGQSGEVGTLNTRLAHAKGFVVDEFIQVQIIAGGYRHFIRPPSEYEVRPANMANLNGWVSTSRFNRIRPVRTLESPQGEKKK